MKKHSKFWEAKFLSLASATLFISLCAWNNLQAQTVQSSSRSDSLSPKTFLELDYLQLKLQISTIQDSSLIQEITIFEKLFAGALQTGDLQMARFYLSSAKDLLKDSGRITISDAKTEEVKNSPTQDFQQSPVNNLFYVTTGMDVSRQDFEIVYSGQDSNLLDATNNPITAVGTEGSWEYSNLSALRWNGIFKYSRDYWLTTLHGAAEKSFYRNQRAQFWVDIESMAYKRDIQLKYAQVYSGLQWRGNLNSYVAGFAQYEFLRRTYDHQDESFPNYRRNQFWGGFVFSPGFLTSVQVSAQSEMRQHDVFHRLDYTNSIYSAKANYMNVKRSKFSLQLDRRFLTYTHAPLDSAFYLGSYRDWYMNFRAGQGLASWLGFEVNAEFTNRNYKNHSTYLQDFNYITVTPAIKFIVNSFLNFEIGYLNIQKKYHIAEKTTTLIAVKNYTVVGPTLSLDFFNMKNLLISGSISYELRRYKDSNNEVDGGFNFYTDQNETTAMLFLSWQFLKNWELDAIAHRDAAIDQELKHNDSRLSLFTVELKRKF